METLIDLLLPMGLLLIVGKIAEGALARIGLNAIFSYVFAGLLLGPVLGVVELTPELLIITDIGIFLLFFIIGFDEIDVAGFVATLRGRYFVAAVVSVLISTAAALMVTSDVFGFSFALGMDLQPALALAGILSMSSLGLVAKVLQDGGHLRDPIGLKIFAIVIIAEALVLLLVGFTIDDSQSSVSVQEVATLLGKMGAFIVAAWLLSTRILPPAIDFLQKLINVPELSFGLLMGGLCLMVVGAEQIHLHGSIGALLFGTALSGLPQRVRKEVMPGLKSASEGLFVPLFFAEAGLRFDTSFTELPILTILALVLVPLAGKFAGSFAGTYLIRVDMPFAMAAGLMAKGVAEIAFLLVLLENGVLESGVFSLLVLIMFGYILFMPFMIESAVKRAKRSDSAPAPTFMPAFIPATYARYALDGIKTRAVVDKALDHPGPEVTVQSFQDDWRVADREDRVVLKDGEFVGIVSPVKVHLVPQHMWPSTPLSEVLRDTSPTALPDEPLLEVLERMTEHSLTLIPVLEPETGGFLGIVTSHEIMDLLMLISEVQRELKSMEAAQAEEQH